MGLDTSRPIVLGWNERVDFPEWKMQGIRAKLDTGARTSALDVESCVLNETPAGLVATFRLAPYRKRPAELFEIRAPVTRLVAVKSSCGEFQNRAEVETSIRLGPVTKRIRLTLTDRSTMRFPLIIGRLALAGDFVVDVARKNVLR